MELIKRMYRFLTIVLLILIPGRITNAQILKDSITFNQMRKGVDYIYNMQFPQAKEIYRNIVKIYPDHPIVYVYKGLINYWENYPLIPSSPQKDSFEQDMQHAIELCEGYAEIETDPEYLLSNIGARGLLLLFYADNDLTRDVISLASSTYQYVKLSFNHTKSYADFYFVTGLYNYYREAYPEAHPVYKPVAFLFPKGDKVRGMKEMQYAAKNAIVLKAESYSFISSIYISFENNFEKAYQYSKSLNELYPRNVQYISLYIKNLLLVKRYNEAETLIKKHLGQNSNKYFEAQLNILNGIVLEKKYNDFRQANNFYQQGIKQIEPFGEFGSEFAAYGYFGLSRITADKQLKKIYRKKALELADFKNVNFDR